MTEHAHTPAPLGGKLWTPVMAMLSIPVIAAVIILAVRFLFGLGAVTNINDGYPWGVWIAYDVFVGSALACGGYSMALLVYIFNKGEYHPLVRPALLASLFGYTLAGASIAFDLGRYWSAWHIFWPGYAQVNSVMLEVAVCITLYIIVMWIEFSPVFLEKLGLGEAKKKLSKWMFFLIALGVLLPTMHQSSIGGMLVIFGAQIHPLWQAREVIPLLYLMTAVLLGYAVVIFEATLVSIGFKRPPETFLLGKMAKFMWGLLIAYLVVRFGDLIWRGAMVTALRPTQEAFWFWIEMLCFVAPALLLLRERDRFNAGKLFASAVLLMAGGFLLRVNGLLVGYETGAGWTYFPSLYELIVTVGLICFEIMAYIAFVKLLPILPRVAVGQAH